MITLHPSQLLQAQPILSIAATSEELKLSVPTGTSSLSQQVFSCVHMRLAFKSALRRIVKVDAGFVTFRARRRNSPNGFDPRLAYDLSGAVPTASARCRQRKT